MSGELYIQSQQQNWVIITKYNKNKMISTKGFYYFNHENPEHNVHVRKIKFSQGSLNQQSQRLNQIRQPSQSITGIEGRSCRNKYFENSRKYLINRFSRKNDGRLTFQRLQYILNATNNSNKQPRTKSKSHMVPNSVEIMQFYRKNSFHTSPSNLYISNKKTPKNKQLKQCLFKSDNRQKRSVTSFSRAFQKSDVSQQLQATQNTRVRQQQGGIAIFPTMSGVFIPSAKYKYNKNKKKNKVKSTELVQRYKTTHNA